MSSDSNNWSCAKWRYLDMILWNKYISSFHDSGHAALVTSRRHFPPSPISGHRSDNLQCCKPINLFQPVSPKKVCRKSSRPYSMHDSQIKSQVGFQSRYGFSMIVLTEHEMQSNHRLYEETSNVQPRHGGVIARKHSPSEDLTIWIRGTISKTFV